MARQRMIWRGVEDPRALALVRHELRLHDELHDPIDLGSLHDAVIVCTQLGYTAAANAYFREWRARLSAQRSRMPAWRIRLESAQLHMRSLRLGYLRGFEGLHRPYAEARRGAKAVAREATDYLDEPVGPMAAVAAFRLLDIYVASNHGERIRSLPALERGLMADARELSASSGIVTRGFQATLAISSAEFGLASHDPEAFADHGARALRLLGDLQSQSTTARRLRAALTVASRRSGHDLAWERASTTILAETA